MSTLVVRNIEPEIVSALKARAGRRGQSAEAAHREILAAALSRRRKRSFAEVLAAIPNVGEDSDFARAQDGPADDVFD